MLTIYLPNFRLKVARERQEQMAEKRQMSEKADEKTQIVCQWQWHNDTVTQCHRIEMIWRHRCLDHPAAQETEILYSYFCENVTTFNLITRSAPYMDSYCRLSKTLWNNCLFNWIVLFNLTAPMLFCTTFFEEEKLPAGLITLCCT